MAARLSFAQFDAKLKSGQLSPAEHRRYLEVDPRTPVVRIRFKSGALRDAPPPGYDVDQEVYLAERADQERRLSREALVAKKRVVAEGDSWFNLPPFIRPEAIADRLESNGHMAVKNIAMWGETLATMLQKKQYLTEIPKFTPDWFIFSGGGNDLQESLAQSELVHIYDAGRPIDQCLSEKGLQLLQQIGSGYRQLLNEIAINHPNLPTICYAYDYPRPTFKTGKYLGQHLKRLGYPKGTWDSVAKVLIDRLSDTVAAVVVSFPHARFLDCRQQTKGFPFYDDMHPGTDGFKALATYYENAMGVSMATAVAVVPRQRAQAKRKTVGSRGTAVSRKTVLSRAKASTRARSRR